ncbi:MAG: TIGR03960 family B12-binding radical SAM protein [Peptococcaceae bacterium]|jgi:radical SAM family uncharacterized protein|nr:TIGR03960 family B12-binding radical SAM protein [Peptococcaceae bacterium]MDH7525534.1 TIGR03960 family B12-binding radical SAM protein [Peptococcaceae bacterium]
MEEIKRILDSEILPGVLKPLRYVGNEYNAVKKDWSAVKLRSLFAFPDLYEVGMSHLGLSIIYHLVNDQPGYLMERVFAPWTDMEKALRERNIPLFSLESCRPIADFDCIGFTLQYEMSYTNILNMLDLGRIPLRSKDRNDDYPLIMGGGPCASNPEPIADYFDFFVLGEGEEAILEVFELISRHRLERGGRQDKRTLLKELARLEGIYVPAFYEPVYLAGGVLKEIRVIETAAPSRVVKRVVRDLDEAYFPLNPIVPYIEVVHDRVMLEVLRGCTRGCRFCQAGMIYRPVRERSRALLEKQAEKLVAGTGYNEISLTSLSTSDYTCVESLVKGLLDKYEKEKVGVSLPSLRVDSFSLELARQVQRVRKTGLTFAPEAGTQRLRDVINKGVTEEDLLEVTAAAFHAGWTQIKLYFMIGLPTETTADLDGIAELARRVLRSGLEILREKSGSRQPKITVSVSSFVPKAHTPFQWEAQDNLHRLREKQQYLKERIRDRRIAYHYHQAELSLLEAVFARGDRRLSAVLMKAWQKGCKFDSWTEHFNWQAWLEAFREEGIEPAEIACSARNYEDVLPWEHLDMGVTKKYLWQEREKAYQTAVTGDCRFESCVLCGVCQVLEVDKVLKSEGKSHAASN